MATESQLSEQINRLFIDKLHLEIPSLDTDLFATAAVDSLHLAELLLHFEQEFGITISVDDLELDNFRTIEHIARFIISRPARSHTQTGSPDGNSGPGRPEPHHNRQAAGGR